MALTDFLTGSPGTSAALAPQYNPALTQINAGQTLQGNQSLQNLVSQYGSGSLSLSDALAQAGNLPGQTVDPYAQQRQQIQGLISQFQANPNINSTGIVSQLQGQLNALPKATQTSPAGAQQTLEGMIATDPMAGSQYAKQQVMQDPTLQGLYGQGGMQSQAEGNYSNASGNLTSDRNALSGNDPSYGLNSQDLAAYGQASGNIGNMFGSAQQSLAQNLANRGLGAAPSGVAAQQFSGLYGNQMEQLAGLQQQISQNRINTAQQLAQARTNADLQQAAQSGNLAQGLGQLGQSAIQNQFGRQMAGSENTFNQGASAAGLNMNNQGLQQNVNNSQFGQQQATSTPGLGQAITSGIGGMAGSALGGIGSGFGSAVGKNLGNSLTSNWQMRPSSNSGQSGYVG